MKVNIWPQKIARDMEEKRRGALSREDPAESHVYLLDYGERMWDRKTNPEDNKTGLNLSHESHVAPGDGDF